MASVASVWTHCFLFEPRTDGLQTFSVTLCEQRLFWISGTPIRMRMLQRRQWKVNIKASFLQGQNEPFDIPSNVIKWFCYFKDSLSICHSQSFLSKKKKDPEISFIHNVGFTVIFNTISSSIDFCWQHIFFFFLLSNLIPILQHYRLSFSHCIGQETYIYTL